MGLFFVSTHQVARMNQYLYEGVSAGTQEKTRHGGFFHVCRSSQRHGRLLNTLLLDRRRLLRLVGYGNGLGGCDFFVAGFERCAAHGEAFG